MPPLNCTYANRDDLLDAVYCGALDPPEAEAIAESLGWAPLVDGPGAAEFDPMAEPWWSLAMTVTWISTRAPDRVADKMEKYRTENLFWVPAQEIVENRIFGTTNKARGWRLKRLPKASLNMLKLDEAIEAADPSFFDQHILSVEAASNDLWYRLSAGKLEAIAFSFEESKPREIKPHEWPFLEVQSDEHDRDFLVYKPKAHIAALTSPIFLRPKVTELWPQSPQARKNTSSGAGKCQRWLETKMRKSPEKKEATKRSLLEEAKREFGISARSFARCWSNAIEATSATAWGRQGRPPKNK